MITILQDLIGVFFWLKFFIFSPGDSWVMG